MDRLFKVLHCWSGVDATSDGVMDILDCQRRGANNKADWARNITRESVRLSLPITGTLVD